jgi:hypothetical protein
MRRWLSPRSAVLSTGDYGRVPLSTLRSRPGSFRRVEIRRLSPHGSIGKSFEWRAASVGGLYLAPQTPACRRTLGNHYPPPSPRRRRQRRHHLDIRTMRGEGSLPPRNFGPILPNYPERNVTKRDNDVRLRPGNRGIKRDYRFRAALHPTR